MASVVNKGRFLPAFPANALGSGPVAVTKAGLAYTFGLDYRILVSIDSSVSTASLTTVQDASTGTYYKITLANLLANNQPLDPALTALAALDATPGALEQTGADTFTKRPFGTATSASILTKADGDSLYQPLDVDLTAVAGLSSNGIIARTGAGAAAVRTLTGTASQISVSNGDGVSGNPTFALTNTAVTPGTYAFSTVTVDQQGRITSASSGSAPGAPVGVLSNCGLAASVAANALTINLTDASGATPTGGSSVSIPFRSATAATGTVTQASVTAANSLVISSGSTMGVTSGAPFRLWLVEFNDAGTYRLGAMNCRTSSGVYPLNQFGIASSTAEGGAGAADNAGVFYTGTAVTSKAYTVIGYLEWASGLTTAGTWDAAPSRIEVFRPGNPLPGTVIQTQATAFTTSATGTTILPQDNTIPQITEGNEYMTQAITPTSTANDLEITANAMLFSSAGNSVGIALFQDATANALTGLVGSCSQAAGVPVTIGLSHRKQALTTSSTTFRIRAGGATAGTTTFNGQGGTQIYGGVAGSSLQVVERMA